MKKKWKCRPIQKCFITLCRLTELTIPLSQIKKQKVSDFTTPPLPTLPPDGPLCAPAAQRADRGSREPTGAERKRIAKLVHGGMQNSKALQILRAMMNKRQKSEDSSANPLAKKSNESSTTFAEIAKCIPIAICPEEYPVNAL